ncbi:hypothetical protein LCGC14_2535070 [marine sediment metagenome]|uniref:Uncharacterized protein n=1 Tax=marine sediment metagenome TaxID=412755 RepID=A0A0F9BFA4_9ZZZZ
MTRRRKKKRHNDDWGMKVAPEESAALRMAWVRGVWTDDWKANGKFTIGLNGKNGIQQRLREVFGRGARDTQLMEIQKDVLSEMVAAKNVRRIPNPVLTKRQMETMGPKEPAQLKLVSPDKLPEQEAQTMKKPGTTMSAKDVQIRYDYAAQMVKTCAKNTEVQAALRSEYGMGVGYRVMRAVRSAHTGTAKTDTVADRAAKRKALPAVTPTQTGKPQDNLSETIRDAVGLLLDEVPNLLRLHVEVDDTGRVTSCKYVIRSVRHGDVRW